MSDEFSPGLALIMRLQSAREALEHVARVIPEDNEGVGVSTVLTRDEGYETAILDKDGAHPVERYATREEAVAGHQRWVEGVRTLETYVQLGLSDGTFENRTLTVKRFAPGEESGAPRIPTPAVPRTCS